MSLYHRSRQEEELDILDSELLKDYLAYARAFVKPKLSEEAGQELVQVYFYYKLLLETQIFVIRAVLCRKFNEFAELISASLPPGNTTPFEEMSQRWRAVSNIVSDLTRQDLNF